MTPRARQLFELGQSVWLDFIRRGSLLSGEFDSQIRDQGVVGVTSNPTIFQQAIADGSDYDAAIQERGAGGLEGSRLFESIAVEDIQLACDRLMQVHRSTKGLDGRVSLEVNPHLANDTAGTIEEARRLHRQVDRPNVMVKVPATRAGLPAITALIAEGICINVTLTFSLARYEEVMDAYLAGLEQRARRDLPLDDLFSVASFFVSRVDTKVDKVIDSILASKPDDPRGAELSAGRGQAAIANARLAYARFREVFGSPRFEALKRKGARLQRPLWASTSTKNPAYSDTMYVDELIGPDTVNTMPPKTLMAYNDHGSLEMRITQDLDKARMLFERLPALGVPLDRLIEELEPEGVTSFERSYDELLVTLETKRRALAASR